MAVAVNGGVVVSTALSLLVVPAFYLLADRAKATLWAHRGRREPPGPAATAEVSRQAS